MIRTHEARSPVPFVDLATRYPNIAPEIDAEASKVSVKQISSLGARCACARPR